MHTYDCIFWAGPLDISDILSVQYKIEMKRVYAQLKYIRDVTFRIIMMPPQYIVF